MKLKKIVRYINFCTDVTVYDTEDNVKYAGSIIPLQVAAQGDKEIEDFINECQYEEDGKSAMLVYDAMKIINWHLDATEDYEALNPGSKINQYGVTIPTLTINIRKDKYEKPTET